MNKTTIIAECRANPDKIFHLLRENDFAKAKKLFGSSYPFTEWYVQYRRMKVKDAKFQRSYHLDDYQFHMQQLVLAPDVLGYLAEYGKEGE